MEYFLDFYFPLFLLFLIVFVLFCCSSYRLVSVTTTIRLWCTCLEMDWDDITVPGHS